MRSILSFELIVPENAFLSWGIGDGMDAIGLDAGSEEFPVGVMPLGGVR